MQSAKWLIVVALLLAACAPTPPERVAVDAAAKAMGGAEKVQAVNTLLIEGTGEQGNMGQALSPDAPLPVFKVSQAKMALDFAGNRVRTEVTRTPTYVTANTAPQTQVQGVDGDVAYNVAANGMPTRASELTAKDRRMTLYQHPIGALRTSLAQGAQLSNPRKEGSDDVVDITTAQGDKATLYIDSSTSLPSKVVTMTSNDTNWPLGDATVETTFSDYAESDGLKLPNRITSKIDGKYVISDIRVSKYTVNGAGTDLAAPQAAKAAEAPALTAMVTAEPVGKGIWFLAGQSHHSVLVEFADHLALIEAPQNDVRVSAVLAKVKELKPDKPLRYIVNTHHHFDHSGGIRRAMMEDGVTIITHEGNKGFYEEVAKRKSALVPDEFSKTPKAPKIVGVSDKYELKDSTRTVQLYPIPNPHSDTMLIAYFPAERLLVEADLYNPPAPNAPPPPGFPFAPSVVATVQKLGLRVDRVLPIHGFIVPYSNLEAAVRQSTPKAS